MEESNVINPHITLLKQDQLERIHSDSLKILTILIFPDRYKNFGVDGTFRYLPGFEIISIYRLVVIAYPNYEFI